MEYSKGFVSILFMCQRMKRRPIKIGNSHIAKGGQGNWTKNKIAAGVLSSLDKDGAAR